MRKHICIAIVVLVFSSVQLHAGEKACTSLKEDVKNTQSLTEPQKRNLIDQISALIKADEMCAKNLLGRMYYAGGAIEKDLDKAEAIFYDLAQRAYPPALYNLAYFKIKQGSTDAEEILAYLHGIMAKYASDDQWKHLVPNAKDLGWDYIESLSTNANFAGDINQLKETHSLVAENSSKEIIGSYFMSRPTSQVHIPEPYAAQYEAGNESVGFDTILSIIELGLAIANYHYSSKASEATRKRMALAKENNLLASQLRQRTPQNTQGAMARPHTPPSVIASYRESTRESSNVSNPGTGSLMLVQKYPPTIIPPTLLRPTINTPPKLWRPAAPGLPSAYYIFP